MKERTEILISGFGGQGVVRLGQILGLAAVRQRYCVSMLRSHGTEIRGGYVRSQVVISPQLVDSPLVEHPDYFCALSLAAYSAYYAMVSHGLILYDPAFVKPKHILNVRQLAVRANDLATEKLGQPVFANSIMLGALTEFMVLLDPAVVLSTLEEVIPKYKGENKKAFEIGYSLSGELGQGM